MIAVESEELGTDPLCLADARNVFRSTQHRLSRRSVRFCLIGATDPQEVDGKVAVYLRAVPSIAGAHALGERSHTRDHGLLVSTLAFEHLGSSSMCGYKAVGVTVAGSLNDHFVEDRERRVGVAR